MPFEKQNFKRPMGAENLRPETKKKSRPVFFIKKIESDCLD